MIITDKPLVAVGSELFKFQYAVEKSKIRELVEAVGDRNPVYKDPIIARELGYEDVIAPPTFGELIDCWGGDFVNRACSKLGINPIKLLHAGQAYEYLAPIYPGQVITENVKFESFAEKTNGYVYQIKMEYSNQHGELVLICHVTWFERK